MSPASSQLFPQQTAQTSTILQGWPPTVDSNESLYARDQGILPPPTEMACARPWEAQLDRNVIAKAVVDSGDCRELLIASAPASWKDPALLYLPLTGKNECNVTI
jgi:hypothetical protein